MRGWRMNHSLQKHCRAYAENVLTGNPHSTAYSLAYQLKEALAHIAALESQLAWQPIETMPDSGEGLLGQWFENPWTHELRFSAQRINFNGDMRRFCQGPHTNAKGAVWMYTPAPPEVTQ